MKYWLDAEKRVSYIETGGQDLLNITTRTIGGK